MGPLLGLVSGWGLAAVIILGFSGRATSFEFVADALWLSGVGLLPSYFLLHVPLSTLGGHYAHTSGVWLVAGVGFLLALPAAFLVAHFFSDGIPVLATLRYHVTTLGGALWLVAYGCAGTIFSVSLRTCAHSRSRGETP